MHHPKKQIVAKFRDSEEKKSGIWKEIEKIVILRDFLPFFEIKIIKINHI